jgi:hypothetical protein
MVSRFLYSFRGVCHLYCSLATTKRRRTYCSWTNLYCFSRPFYKKLGAPVGIDWLGMTVAAIFILISTGGIIFIVLACIAILVGASAGGDYEDFPHDDEEQYHRPKNK